ncbi:hypothetical protein [uncultured Sphingomonas sp.]|uniref:hypothetical protein n=1 Tax=uncultured Sphingomonas sp. TaxID=158754 RepID=UPI0025CDD996|nr:hypothetical protein [uncultured Sphingomonas sp.]
MALALMLAATGASAADGPPRMVSTLRTAYVFPNIDMQRVEQVRRLMEGYYTKGAEAAGPYLTPDGATAFTKLRDALPASSCAVEMIDESIDQTGEPGTSRMVIALQGMCQEKRFEFLFAFKDGRVDDIVDFSNAVPVAPGMM